MADDRHSHRAFTFRSFGASLLSMIVMAGAINFGGSIDGAFFLFGEEAMAIPALWMLIALSLVSGLVYLATRRRLFTRAEMFFILFSSVIAAPLMSGGFWLHILGRTATIPKSADFSKLDAFNDKLWAHGPNITKGLLEMSQPSAFHTRGNFDRTRIEVDEGVWAELPTLENGERKDFSSFELELPLRRGNHWELLPGQPHILSVLIQARNVEPNSTYFCRVYADDRRQLMEEAFIGSGETPRTFLHKTGFQRFGMYGLMAPFGTAEKIRLEFGLSGKGTVAFRDLQVMNVAALDDAYQGTETITEAEYARLPESHRIGRKVRPDRLFSWEGIQFLFTAYIPVRDWITPSAVWTSFVLCILAAAFSFSVIMRRQWVDRERFLLPLIELPRYLIGFDGEGDQSKALPPIWKNWLMWAGFTPILVWCLLCGWAESDSSIPDLSVKVSMKAYVTDPAAAALLNNVNFTVAAFFLSLAIFMDLHVSLSLLLGYFLFRLQYWFGEAYGWNVEAGYPFPSEQIAGTFLTYAVLILILARRHLGRVVAEAVAGVRQPNEVFSSRAAILIFIGSICGAVLWAKWMDIPVRGILVYFAFLFAIAIVATKLRAECGLLSGSAYPLRFWYMVPIVGGAAFLGPDGAIFWFIFSITVGIRVFFLLPGIQFEMLETGRRLRVHSRHILYTGAMGLFGGFVVGGWIYLAGCYGYGVNYFGDLNSFDLEIEGFGNFVGWHAKATDDYFQPAGVDAAEIGLGGPKWAMIFAGGGTALTVILRQAFAGFWFHPIGFILGPSVMLQYTWGNILLAFLIRFIVLKVGGAQMVKGKLYPVAIGILLGSVIAQAVLLAINAWLYHFQPGTPGIPPTFDFVP